LATARYDDGDFAIAHGSIQSLLADEVLDALRTRVHEIGAEIDRAQVTVRSAMSLATLT
jgi:hypothetical protein